MVIPPKKGTMVLTWRLFLRDIEHVALRVLLPSYASRRETRKGLCPLCHAFITSEETEPYTNSKSRTGWHGLIQTKFTKGEQREMGDQNKQPQRPNYLQGF